MYPMLSYLERGPSLAIVLWIQSRRNRVLDCLARGLHVLGHPAVTATLLSGYARQAGNLPLITRIRRVTVWQLLLIYGLKFLLRRPRPHLAFPDQVQGLVWQPGYGIPSGHVVGALVYGSIIVENSDRAASAYATGAYALLAAWARLYLGVHYPQDIVVGAVMGLLIVRYYELSRFPPLPDVTLPKRASR